MQFNYSQYAQYQEQTKKSNGNNQKTRFINEFVKNENDVCVVRFPYDSRDDFLYESVHKVTFPGDKFGKWVRCEPNCPLCAQGIKKDIRFFAKAIVYEINDAGEVIPHPAIWDRPAAFADIELTQKMEECKEDEMEPFSDNLIKIKRTGQGRDTRYNLTLVHNKTIYNPEVYKKDFTELDKIDASKILSKSLQQYYDAFQITNESNEIPVNQPQAAVPNSRPQYSSAPVNTVVQPTTPTAKVSEPQNTYYASPAQPQPAVSSYQPQPEVETAPVNYGNSYQVPNTQPSYYNPYERQGAPVQRQAVNENVGQSDFGDTTGRPNRTVIKF